MDLTNVSKRRTFFSAAHTNSSDADIAAASPEAGALGTPSPSRLAPLPPSESTVVAAASRRHARGDSVSASAAAEAPLQRVEGEPSPRSQTGGGMTQPMFDQTVTHRGSGGEKGHGQNDSSSGGNSPLRIYSGGGLSSAAPLAAAARRLRRRAWQLASTFRWRRRATVDLVHRLSRLIRHNWCRRLVVAGAVVGAALFWFLVITTVVGPARGGGGGPAGRGGIGGSNVDVEGGDAAHGYYRRIIGEVAVGPSLLDPWKVRDINIAAARWGQGAHDAYGDGGGSAGGGQAGISIAVAAAAAAAAAGVEGLAEGAGKRTIEEWDGRVNSVVTGELEPAGGAKTRQKVDLLLTIFSGSTEPDAAKRDLLRQIYDKYEGWVKVGGPDSITGGTNPERREFTVSTVFVMSKASAPPEGQLVGDILYVPVPEGYRNIVLKTKAMLCLVRHFDFKFLLKADDDSFVCLARIASMLHDLDPALHGKIYAGVPTACNQKTNPDFWNGRVMKDPIHKWFDSKYVQHTLGGLDCFPPYMQGAFYILSQPLVEHLYRGHEHLECFTNEDVTIGSWLMGVDREMVEMYNLLTSHLWDCLCARTQITTKTRRKQMFFHNCKGMSQLKLCGTRLLRPGIGC